MVKKVGVVFPAGMRFFLALKLLPQTKTLLPTFAAILVWKHGLVTPLCDFLYQMITKNITFIILDAKLSQVSIFYKLK